MVEQLVGGRDARGGKDLPQPTQSGAVEDRDGVGHPRDDVVGVLVLDDDLEHLAARDEQVVQRGVPREEVFGGALSRTAGDPGTQRISVSWPTVVAVHPRPDRRNEVVRSTENSPVVGSVDGVNIPGAGRIATITAPPAVSAPPAAPADPVAVPAFPPSAGVLFGMVLDPAEGNHAFATFAAQQVEHQPPVRNVFRQLGRAMSGPRAPKRVADLYALARTLAAQQVTTPGNDPVAHARRVNLVAVVAVAAHALGVAGENRMAFPGFIPDDREGSFAMDRAWHVAAQCMFAYVWLFDRTYGDGKLADSMDAVAAAMDPNGDAKKVDEAYDRVKGYPSSLLPGTLGGPPAYDDVWAFIPRPDFDSALHESAWDQAVRVGSAYELKGTPGSVDLDRLGDHSDLEDPTARIEATLHVFGGLGDGFVTGDLSGNRAGASLGVQLFDAPDTVPAVPFDDGPDWKGRAWAERKVVPRDAYYADESVLIAKLGGMTGGRATTSHEAHASWARSVTPEAARDELIAKIEAQVDRLAATDRDTLARFYATFATRQLRWRVPFAAEGMQNPSWDAHHAYAMNASADLLKWELGQRVKEIAARFS